jgi:hypothetical protein
LGGAAVALDTIREQHYRKRVLIYGTGSNLRADIEITSSDRKRVLVFGTGCHHGFAAESPLPQPLNLAKLSDIGNV